MPRAPMPRRRSSGRICCSKLRQVPSRQLSGSWTVPNGFSCAKQNLLKCVLSLSDAGDREVPAVDRVEGAAKERELHHLSDASAEGGVRVRRYFRKNPKGVRARA